MPIVKTLHVTHFVVFQQHGLMSKVHAGQGVSFKGSLVTWPHLPHRYATDTEGFRISCNADMPPGIDTGDLLPPPPPLGGPPGPPRPTGRPLSHQQQRLRPNMNNRGPSGGPPVGHAPAGSGRKREYDSAFPDQGMLSADAKPFVLHVSASDVASDVVQQGTCCSWSPHVE